MSNRSAYGLYVNCEDENAFVVIHEGRVVGTIDWISARQAFAYRGTGFSSRGYATELLFAFEAVQKIHRARQNGKVLTP